MKILLILGHPDPDSLNHAIAHAVRDDLRSVGHEVVFHDLCEEGFSPMLTSEEIPESATIHPVLEAHCEELASADGIVIVHPNWWGQPPAILKGWIDRVFRPGVAYRFEEGDDGLPIPRRTAYPWQVCISKTILEVDIFHIYLYIISVHNVWRKIWLFKQHTHMHGQSWLLCWMR